MLALNRVTEAEQGIAELTSSFPDEPFSIYLEGIAQYRKGDVEALVRTALTALDKQKDDTALSRRNRSNRALWCLVTEDYAKANTLLTTFLDDHDYAELRYFTTPYLKEFNEMMEERTHNKETVQNLERIVYPQEIMREKTDLRKKALISVRRGEYPFPMYCQNSCIGGLEQDKRLGDSVLNWNRSSERSMVLWTLGSADRLYGQGNFKKDFDADYELKFCEKYQVLVSSNLKIFVQEFGLKRLLFLEESLLKRIEPVARRFNMACELADVKEEFKVN